ncbi:hypothetical protein Lmac_1771 [Legionella maceachernii]|uniref:Uncharacterized protein n=2 Tax=Legionellaceae TaxID=444 RepID=A0A0W0W0P1_9GAMM|nr:hypothetical protein Lmac_1771 [Legionella maceachernii]
MLTLFELAFTKKELPVKITIKTIVDAHKTEIKEMCELRQKIAAFARRVADLEEEKKRLLQSAQEQEKNLRIGGHQSRK